MFLRNSRSLKVSNKCLNWFALIAVCKLQVLSFAGELLNLAQDLLKNVRTRLAEDLLNVRTSCTLFTHLRSAAFACMCIHLKRQEECGQALSRSAAARQGEVHRIHEESGSAKAQGAEVETEKQGGNIVIVRILALTLSPSRIVTAVFITAAPLCAAKNLRRMRLRRAQSLMEDGSPGKDCHDYDADAGVCDGNVGPMGVVAGTIAASVDEEGSVE